MPKPTYFLFLPSYWVPRNKQAMDAGEKEDRFDPSAHEMVPDDLEAGISMKNITKIYDQASGCKLCDHLT